MRISDWSSDVCSSDLATFDRGCFLTLEGVDGAGKSTFIPSIVSNLEAQGIEVVCTREPGGTATGEKLRHLMLHEPMDLKTEVLLMFASRAEHIKQVIEPALQAGKWVVCDRFTDSSFAYQGGGRKLGGAFIEQLEQLVHPDLQPDLTWFFDVPLDVARQRMSTTRDLDRFELEGQARSEEHTSELQSLMRISYAVFCLN